jgi:lambda family phage portal protein
VRESKILGPDGRPLSVSEPDLRPRARYDAAQTNDENKRHWAAADALSARAANDPGSRARLRNRARYERANNGYCQGLTLTLANDVVGTGPTLQVLTDSDDANDQVETRFAEWAEEIGLADDLHTMKQAKAVDGESVAIFHSNPHLEGPQLDLDLIEAEQLAHPYGVPISLKMVDGIELDDARQPVRYHVLREHPGDNFLNPLKWDVYPARQVVHWFRRDRPRQYRGVPEITASLPLFAQLRRYTLAVLTAAEIAADFSLLLETDSPASATPPPTPFESMDIDRGMMTTLPAGVNAKQLDAKQPTSTYEAFKREILKEIGRCVNAPFNVISGDSSLYNYSSARLDHLLYRGSILVEREHCRRNVLERIFAAWYAEARLIPGYLPANLPDILPHKWRWPGFSTIDPLKEALADTERLSNGTDTLAGLLAEENRDWEEEIDQRAREVERFKKLGLPLPKWATGGGRRCPSTTPGRTTRPSPRTSRPTTGRKPATGSSSPS